MSKRYIRPDNANIVVAGSKDEVADKLAKYSADGKIDYYDFSGKPATPTAMMAAPSGMTADVVFKKYIDAMGGAGGINGVKDIRITGTSQVQGMQLTITELKKSPNKWKQSIDMAMGDQKMTLQKKQVFDGKRRLPGGEPKESRHYGRRPR